MKVQKYIVFVCVLCLISITLTACFGPGGLLGQRLRMLNNDPYKNTPFERMDFIETAVRKGDRAAIYDVFSPEAKEIGISDESLDALIGFLQPDIDTIFNKRSLGDSIKNNYGEKIIKIRYAANIVVNDIEYKLDLMSVFGTILMRIKLV